MTVIRRQHRTGSDGTGARPLMWPPYLRLLAGVSVALGSWAVVFFGFMALTVRQSRKGFRVEIVTGSRKRIRSQAE